MTRSQLWSVATTLHGVHVPPGLSTPTEHPQNSRELFRLQQACTELTICPLDGSLVFFYGYFICQPLITAYSVNTSFIDCSDYV